MPRRLGIPFLLAALACAAAALPASSAITVNPSVTVAIDANVGRHAISPYVYGTAYATTAELNDLNDAGEPLRREQREPLQLAAERGQPRRRLVLRVDRRLKLDARRARRHLHLAGEGRRRAGARHDPDARVGREARLEPEQARELLAGEVRRADGQRLAVVP